MKNLFLVGMIFGSVTLFGSAQAMDDDFTDQNGNFVPNTYDPFAGETPIVATFDAPVPPPVPPPAPNPADDQRTSL